MWNRSVCFCWRRWLCAALRSEISRAFNNHIREQRSPRRSASSAPCLEQARHKLLGHSGCAAPLILQHESTSGLIVSHLFMNCVVQVMDSCSVVVLDIRIPSIPVASLQGHEQSVNAIAWAPHSHCHICSAGDDSQALIWDLQALPRPIEGLPILFSAHH